ncbi:Hypothetical protein FNO222_1509 [Francisella orientalis]|uniref:Uncharacterized protein n=1 Tax=Francisella orientalis TaxID=299583 RepID=A0ABM5U810_9GAMM|nr:hypothetical protein FNO12_1495 [Francisella orientalis FNO12]AKN87586.1 Hypothetical protein FNO24_1497 [Francisella orientalis FNO24]AKN89124.1 Hypothetical protein FNO190_1495 [Francisella orientalis]AKU05883.1 Hypothetical protein FNO01_1495 [Francisella orientalis]QEN20800.1 Hypothetical protein FNO39_1509 [Francisella orientalis]
MPILLLNIKIELRVCVSEFTHLF